MATFEEKIVHEIYWRTGEISIIKSLPFLYPISADQREVIIKHTIPIFYSLWEGYVAEAFEIYSHEINSFEIPTQLICPALVAHTVDMSLFLHQPRIEFDKKVKYMEELQTLLSKKINIPVQVPTESNVNFKVINRILVRYNLELLPEDPFKRNLDNLLFLRNKLSHGEFSIVITREKVDEMSNVVISSMHILCERIMDGITKKTYLR